MNSTIKAAFFHLFGKTECFASSIFSFKLLFGLHQVSNVVRLLFGAEAAVHSGFTSAYRL